MATDWNDLQQKIGIDGVRAQLSDLYKSAQDEAQRQLDLGEDADCDMPDIDDLPPVENYDDENAAREPAKLWLKRLKRNDRGNITPCAFNLHMIFSNDARWHGVLGYCEFSYRIIKLKKPPTNNSDLGEWSDSDTSSLKIWLTGNYSVVASKEATLDALVVTARENSFHPVRKYLSGLVWDGELRLERWLVECMGASAKSDNRKAYLASAGTKFLIGAVARVMRPGCKMDNVLIFEGEQGRGKSTAVHALFGEWYSDAPLPLGDKDAYQNITGIWGYEMAELDSFNKAESTTAKSFFSQIRDRYRPSYGTMAEDFKRQVVFLGTTNQDEYLRDYTGNRRYWPVRCHRVNVDLVRQWRDQLWAEALACYKADAIWWPTYEEKLIYEAEQDSRLQLDPWHYPIQDYLHAVISDFVTTDEILLEAIKRDHAHQTRQDQNRISPIMKSLGWINKRKLVNGKQKRGYQKPEGWDKADGGVENGNEFQLPG